MTLPTNFFKRSDGTRRRRPRNHDGRNRSLPEGYICKIVHRDSNERADYARRSPVPLLPERDPPPDQKHQSRSEKEETDTSIFSSNFEDFVVCMRDNIFAPRLPVSGRSVLEYGALEAPDTVPDKGRSDKSIQSRTPEIGPSLQGFALLTKQS